MSLIERRDRALLVNQNVNSASTGLCLPMKDSGLIVHVAKKACLGRRVRERQDPPLARRPKLFRQVPAHKIASEVPFAWLHC
jgi:hypothetical protein